MHIEQATKLFSAKYLDYGTVEKENETSNMGLTSQVQKPCH